MKDEIKVKAKCDFDVLGVKAKRGEVVTVSKFVSKKLIQLNRVFLVEDKPVEKK